MKLLSILFQILLVFLTSCQSNYSNCDEVVCETVHRYGVPLKPEDWSNRGQDGQIISMRKDGVKVVRTYEGGVLNGESNYSFPNRDMVQKKEIYNQGTLEKEFFQYPNGLPKQQITYDSPNHQSHILWFENGAPQAIEKIENLKLVEGEYYDINHQKESFIEKYNGERINRDASGQLDSRDTIKDGQMIFRTTYHKNGNPATYTPYVNGNIEGERCTFLSGSEPATIEEWHGNIQHGMTTVFDHGEKLAEVPYENGLKNGIEYRYRNGETIAQEITWVKGHQHGPTRSFVNDMIQTDWYFHDRYVPNKATFDMLSNQ